MVLNQSVAISYILCIGLNWSSFNSSVLHFSKRIQTFPLLLYIFTYAHTKHSTPCHLAWILEQPIKFLFTNCRRMAAFVYGQETFTRPIKWFLRREHWVNIFVETFAISLLLVISLSQLRFYSWEKQVAASHFSTPFLHCWDILWIFIPVDISSQFFFVTFRGQDNAIFIFIFRDLCNTLDFTFAVRLSTSLEL